jgi:hypothetical protein
MKLLKWITPIICLIADLYIISIIGNMMYGSSILVNIIGAIMIIIIIYISIVTRLGTYIFGD